MGVADRQEKDEGGGDGVEIWRHPRRLLEDCPRIWGVVDRWRVGARRQVDPEAYRTLSYFEIECLLILQGADARQEQRRHIRRTEAAE